ncbi:hypothetical protein K8R78_07645 [bacterium]|nr:hypothetical protein [bacterium]
MKRFLALLVVLVFGMLLLTSCAQKASPRISWIESRGGGDEVYLHELDSDETSQLTFSRGSKLDPAFSADGRAVLFASDSDGDFDIYRVSLDADEAEKLTANLVDDRFPAAGMEEAEVIYLTLNNTNYILRMADWSDTGLDLIEEPVTASLDRRGARLLYQPEGEQALWVYDLATHRREQIYLAEPGKPLSDATWSYDGESVLFSLGSGDWADLYLVDLESGIATRLTNEVGIERFPRSAEDNEGVYFYGTIGGVNGVYLRSTEEGRPPRLELIVETEGEVKGLAVYP